MKNVILSAVLMFTSAACTGRPGANGVDGVDGATGATATVDTHTTCTGHPTGASGAQMVPGGVTLTYEVYRYSDGAALVTASDARQDGERTKTALYSATQAAAKVELPIDLLSDVDTASGGAWTFTFFADTGDHGAQAKYVDFSSTWNNSSWWMTCATQDVR